MSSNRQSVPVQRELQRSFPSVYGRQSSAGTTSHSVSATTSRPVLVPNVSNSNPARRAVALVPSSTSLTVPVSNAYQRQTRLNPPCAPLTRPTARVSQLNVPPATSSAGVDRVRVADAVSRLGQQTQQPTVQTTLDFSSCRGTGGVGQVRLFQPGQPGAQPLQCTHSTALHEESDTTMASNSSYDFSGQLRMLGGFRRVPTCNQIAFNRRQNYIPSHSRSRMTRKQSVNPYLSSDRFSKTIVLVSSEEDAVPRGPRRQELNELGAVVHLVDFYKSWSEGKVRETIETVLRGFIDTDRPEPRIEFLKATGGKLMQPNVSEIHEWTGEKVKQIAGQGDIYIRTTYPLQLEIPSDSPDVNRDGETHDGVHPKENPQKCDIAVEEVPDTFKPEIEQIREILGCECDSASIEEALQTSGGDSHQAINILLDKADFLFKPVATHSVLSVGDAVAGPSSMSVNDVETAVPCSLQNLLTHHITKMLDTSSVCELELCRERLWRQSLSFYKNSLHKPFRLTQEFIVEFVGEEGIDAGALRNDFFEHLLREIDERLFEGNTFRKIPKKDWNTEHLLEISGVMIAHSIVQGGPTFCCLCPAVYSYMVYGSKERALEELPSAEDIPRNAATSGICSLIEEIDNAQTEKDIDSILDESENMSIINSSGWPVTQQITLANKTALLQGLIFDEVIAKRQDHIAAFQKGLERLEVMELIRKHPQQMRKLFVHSDETLNADQFLSLIETPQTTPVTHQTWVWCKEYIVERSKEKTGDELEGKERANLRDVLKFVTGLRHPPPLGLSKNISIQFISHPAKTLPQAKACFNLLELPTNASSKEEFFWRFDTAVLGSVNYFGQE